MKDLRIGQVVRVSAISRMTRKRIGQSRGRFDEKRILRRELCKHPFLAVVTGQVKKLFGNVCWEGWQDCPITFTATSGIYLWEVRISLRNKPILVFDDDIEPADETFAPPRMLRANQFPQTLFRGYRDHDSLPKNEKGTCR